jgi:hypothetical protein
MTEYEGDEYEDEEPPPEGDPGWTYYDPDAALTAAATTVLLSHATPQAGGWRHVDQDHGLWDFTIKWPDAINYAGNLTTVRMNVHCGPNFTGGWTYGSMWIDGVQGYDLQIANVTPNAAVSTAAQTAYDNSDTMTPGDALF